MAGQERISPVPLDLDVRQIARLEARIEDLNNMGLLLKRKPLDIL